MSHCAPEATLKLRRFQFTPKTVLWNVFVVQVYWEAVPNTWSGSSKASVTKCVVCAWNSARSVGGRAKPTSWTFWNQVYVVSQVRRCLARQRRVNETRQLEVDTSLDRKPVQLMQNWRDVVHSSSSSERSREAAFWCTMAVEKFEELYWFCTFTYLSSGNSSSSSSKVVVGTFVYYYTQSSQLIINIK